MINHKKIDFICVGVLVVAIIATLLFMNGEKLGLQKIVDEDTEGSEAGYFTQNDMDGEWDISEGTQIVLEGATGTIQGDGAYFVDGNLVIAKAGKYCISGNLTDGYIQVDTNKKAKVWIALNDIDVYCSDDACLQVNKADKVFVTLVEGTANRMESGAEISVLAEDEGRNSAWYAKDDLTINGSGSLTIVGAYEHGITCKDDLVVTGGTVSIQAVQDGIHGKNSFYMADGNLLIEAGDDAIHADESIVVCGGEVTVTDCYEGLEAFLVDIQGGNIDIIARDDGINACSDEDSAAGMARWGMKNPNGMEGQRGMDGAEESPRNAGVDPEESHENVEQFDKTRPDQMGGFDKPEDWGKMSRSEGRPQMPGGEMERPEGIPEMPGGEMQRPEGLPEMSQESMGEMKTVAADDDMPEVRISGGTVKVVNETGMDADGIDSNGNIIINGGEVSVFMKNGSSNNALDWGSESGGICEINGGSVVATGGASMLETISNTSKQASLTVVFDESIQNGDVVRLLSDDGEELYSCLVPYGCEAFTISTDRMKVGNTVTLVWGETSNEYLLETVATSSGTAKMNGFGGKRF